MILEGTPNQFFLISHSLFALCPLHSPDLAIPDHPNIIQLTETRSLYLNPSAQQLIQFSQTAHLWPVLLNDNIYNAATIRKDPALLLQNHCKYEIPPGSSSACIASLLLSVETKIIPTF